MTSKPVGFLMADLGVTKTHSRRYVSDDNPYFVHRRRNLWVKASVSDAFR